jgi:hypothetical protein
MDNLILRVRDFSITPGPREPEEGDFSGKNYREIYLKPKFNEAVEKKVKLIVDLDGTIGYGTSWLEEVFGGLSRENGKEIVLKHIEFKSEEEPYLINDIEEYITNA